METKQEWVQFKNRENKFVHQWHPRNDPPAVVFIVHGLGEHGGRYARLAQDFVQTGFAVVSFDQQGHGQSSRKRGSIQSYETLLDDIEEMLRWTSKQFSGIPTTLFGHSMGGNLVLNYALRRSFRPAAVISSSPMIRSMRSPNGFMEFALRAIMRIAPDMQLKSMVIPERLMSDPAEQQALRHDELFHSRLTLRLGAGLIDSGRWLLENATSLTTPTLLTHGTNDYLTSHHASQEFAELAGGRCTLELYEGQLHDTFRDLERDRVIQRFVAFIQQHCNGTPT